MTDWKRSVADIWRRFNLQNDNGHDHDLTNLDVQIILTELERLQQENAQLRAEISRMKRGGWVSVKERLPELGQGVLVIDRDGSQEVATFAGDCFVGHDGIGADVNYFTHWMTLPEPPKEDDES